MCDSGSFGNDEKQISDKPKLKSGVKEIEEDVN